MSILPEAPSGFQIGLVVAYPPPLGQGPGAVFAHLPAALPGAGVGNRVCLPSLPAPALRPSLPDTLPRGAQLYSPGKDHLLQVGSQHRKSSLRPKWLLGKIFCESLEGAGRGRKGWRRKWSLEHLLPPRRQLGVFSMGPQGQGFPTFSELPCHPGSHPLHAPPPFLRVSSSSRPAPAPAPLESSNLFCSLFALRD